MVPFFVTARYGLFIQSLFILRSPEGLLFYTGTLEEENLSQCCDEIGNVSIFKQEALSPCYT